MLVSRILSGLEKSDANGVEAERMARIGFVEWAFQNKSEAPVMAARVALESDAAQNPTSAAAKAFVGFLEQACQSRLCANGRRRRARRLH